MRRRGLFPIGENVIVVNSGGINTERYSITALVQLNEKDPVIISDPHGDSNNQLDFIKFLIKLVEERHLVRGDTLILDNASVHAGLDTIEILSDLLTITGVSIVFLPTYSPELNPIELVFGWVKRTIREQYRNDIPMWLNVIAAFAAVNLSLVKKFYKHCFYSFYMCVILFRNLKETIEPDASKTTTSKNHEPQKLS